MCTGCEGMDRLKRYEEGSVGCICYESARSFFVFEILYAAEP